MPVPLTALDNLKGKLKAIFGKKNKDGKDKKEKKEKKEKKDKKGKKGEQPAEAQPEGTAPDATTPAAAAPAATEGVSAEPPKLEDPVKPADPAGTSTPCPPSFFIFRPNTANGGSPPENCGHSSPNTVAASLETNVSPHAFH
ncbi:hypothetical protein F4775DRAFT_538289 [Biscogniauxia sp. FL1348]|nr:hypothetical protein F4775DRAFT_538289 [Biscogniauxia sp. FL1348]